MPRIPNVRDESIDPAAKDMLAAAESKIGRLPNMLLPLAQSPTALDAYLSLSDVVARGTFTARLREQIALAVSGANECSYCASAHAAIGKMAQIDDAEVARNLKGEATDSYVAAILSLVTAILDRHGAITDAELAQARDAGLSDGEIVEVVANITLHLFTNYFNRLAQPEIDFPVVSFERQAA